MLDPRTHHTTNSSFPLYDETRHKTWEATTTNSDFYWPSKPAQLRIEHMEVDDASDTMRSPPRWTSSSSTSSSHYRSLSPTSRTEAIVRGQRELMEMVRNMPESNYELSLKDLVEHHHREVVVISPKREENTKKLDNNKKIMPRVKSVERNGNIDGGGAGGGFYLKVAFPFSLGSNKDKKKKTMKKNENSCSSKVSPKTSVSVDHGSSVKEWWKKSPSVLRESDSAESSVNSGSIKSSGSSSTNSTSSRRSNSRREKGGCWRFIRRRKSQTKK